MGALLAQRLASWRGALRSVYLAMRLGQCPAFYLVMQVGRCAEGREGGRVWEGGGGIRSGLQALWTGVLGPGSVWV